MGARVPTAKPCLSKEDVGIPTEAWNLRVTLPFPKCLSSARSCLGAPSRQQALRPGLGVWWAFRGNLPPASARAPAATWLRRCPAQTRSYSPVTHRLPLPLILFLFGFNEPNPLVSPWRQGGGSCKRVVVWGESRRVTLGPGLRGSHVPTLRKHTLFNSHDSPARWGHHSTWYRPGCWLRGFGTCPGHGVPVRGARRWSPSKITPEPCGQSPESCLLSSSGVSMSEGSCGERHPLNPRPLLSNHHWLSGLRDDLRPQSPHPPLPAASLGRGEHVAHLGAGAAAPELTTLFD